MIRQHLRAIFCTPAEYRREDRFAALEEKVAQLEAKNLTLTARIAALEASQAVRAEEERTKDALRGRVLGLTSEQPQTIAASKAEAVGLLIDVIEREFGPLLDEKVSGIVADALALTWGPASAATFFTR
ncbi:hypothetical protein [Segnochrobactrum spirostomi]|uniref:Uncharacterized protein n=1 Tax=Segnochrobactrum spirostomi TaxID=2608987 RepID=A0A6A7Y7Q1_9HYPH|nr:hypothetical protein [Segnochrobactrum spirostomi]MQT13682.1 hypothetical protein [Segnochrobactrum spirostomi]